MYSEYIYQCPVCGFIGLTRPAYSAGGESSFEICPCCGVQFGYDDVSLSFEELRSRWIQRGMHWSSTAFTPPDNWDPDAHVAPLVATDHSSDD